MTSEKTLAQSTFIVTLFLMMWLVRIDEKLVEGGETGDCDRCRVGQRGSTLRIQSLLVKCTDGHLDIIPHVQPSDIRSVFGGIDHGYAHDCEYDDNDSERKKAHQAELLSP